MVGKSSDSCSPWSVGASQSICRGRTYPESPRISVETLIQIPDVITALDRDHANIAKLLEILESEILAIEVGKTPDYYMLKKIMRYMTQYPDEFHHPKEDRIFARLATRRPEIRADIEEISKEHATIGSAGQKLNGLLRSSDIDSVNVREALAAAGLDYVRTLREHMLMEEGIFFPLAMEALTKEDWQQIDESIESATDPLFGEKISDEFQKLYALIIDRTESRSGNCA